MSTEKKKTIEKRTLHLTPLAIFIVTGILFFGLWPRSWPSGNDARLLQSDNTLRFHGSGIVYTDNVPLWGSNDSRGSFTIHLSVAPETIQKNGFKPILVFNDGDEEKQLTVWHWGPSLVVMNGNDYNHARKWPRISALNSLKSKESIFITISTGKDGTRLFLNGTVVHEARELTLSIPSGGDQLRLILGNSVYGKNGWAGDLHHFALLDKAFSNEEVLHYYDWWAAGGITPPPPISELSLLYTFSAIEGKLIPDLSGNDIPLHVPSKVTVFKRALLTVPPLAFKPNRLFWTDAILNFIAFIPLGAVIFGWFHQKYTLPVRKKMCFSLAFCFFLSLFMEIIQGWLPHRFSSLLDLILNTFGAAVGVLFMTWIMRSSKTGSTR